LKVRSRGLNSSEPPHIGEMMGSKLVGKVCRFCNSYVITDLKGFVEHLKTCNLAAYHRLARILGGEGHEHQRQD
jgi:hypothetical protein